MWTNFQPIDIVHCFHNAFRRDMMEIDEAALIAARNDGDFAPILDRFHIMGEILDYHARGEQEAVFPAIEKLAPFLAKTYIIDHCELDSMVASLEAMRTAINPLTVARATAVLNSHLKIHLYKEDVHLYPILRERTHNR